MKKLSYLLFFIFSVTKIICQNSTIKGKVFDATNNETIPFANVFVEQTNTGVASDFDGFYELKNLKPGLYTVKCSFIGYEPIVYAEVIVNPNKPTILNIKLIESSTSLDVVEITASPFQKSEESPM